MNSAFLRTQTTLPFFSCSRFRLLGTVGWITVCSECSSASRISVGRRNRGMLAVRYVHSFLKLL